MSHHRREPKAPPRESTNLFDEQDGDELAADESSSLEYHRRDDAEARAAVNFGHFARAMARR